jgi:hypothetical protein
VSPQIDHGRQNTNTIQNNFITNTIVVIFILCRRWGAEDPDERGPVVATNRSDDVRNAIGAHGGSYCVYRALAAATGKLDLVGVWRCYFRYVQKKSAYLLLSPASTSDLFFFNLGPFPAAGINSATFQGKPAQVST